MQCPIEKIEVIHPGAGYGYSPVVSREMYESNIILLIVFLCEAGKGGHLERESQRMVKSIRTVSIGQDLRAQPIQYSCSILCVYQRRQGESYHFLKYFSYHDICSCLFVST